MSKHTIPYDEGLVVGVGDSWSHLVHSQEAETYEHLVPSLPSLYLVVWDSYICPQQVSFPLGKLLRKRPHGHIEMCLLGQSKPS